MQKVSGSDPLRLAAIKGGVAGTVNLALAVSTGTDWPPAAMSAAALAVGLSRHPPPAPARLIDEWAARLERPGPDLDIR